MPKRSQRRLYAYVDPHVAAEFERRAEEQGISAAALLSQLIQDFLPTGETYYGRQTGHQVMLTVALVGALAKKSLTAGEMKDVRELAKKAAGNLFGAVPPRPFTADLVETDDPRLEALHNAILSR